MKRIAQSLVSIIFILSIGIFSCGCDNSKMKSAITDSPSNQPGTCWTNNNENVFLYVDNDLKISGYILNEERWIPITATMAIRNGVVLLYQSEAGSSGEKPLLIEKWNCIEILSDEEFSVTVSETTFFSIGDQIIFHRIEGDGGGFPPKKENHN